MGKKAKKQSKKSSVSQKRKTEISETFKTLGITHLEPYYGASEFSKEFQKVSIYDSESYYYSTSNSSNG